MWLPHGGIREWHVRTRSRSTGDPWRARPTTRVCAPTLLVRLPEAPPLKGATPLGERVAAGAWALQARKEVEQARWGVVHRLSSIVYGLWSNVRHASDAWSLGFSFSTA